MINARGDSPVLSPLGAVVNERYRVEGELGRGGMAVVYLAEDLKYQRRVAIKLLNPELSSSLPGERFLREITLAARLSHPNILPVYDSGEVGGLLYYVMPYAQGESLRDRLTRDGTLATEDAVTLVREVADALTHAHAEGVIHRDIKPENILISGGHALVSDFGIARAMDVAGGERLTATGVAIGTPAYMSPEQAAGNRAVDARSDVYSLACVAYEMLGGDPPFTGGNAQAIMARHVVDKPLPLRSVRPTISAALDAVLAKALAKIPSDRFATPMEFAEALTRAHASGDVKLSLRPIIWLRQRSHALTAIVAVVAVTALVAVLTQQWIVGRANRIASVALLPFDNLGDPAQEYFVRGMRDALRGSLIQARSVRVLWTLPAYRATTKADTTIARELGVDAVLRGSVVRDGDSVHMQIRLVQARPRERLLWSRGYDRHVRNVLAMHDEAAQAVAKAASLELPGAARPQRNRSLSPEAYDAYLRGTYYISIPQPDSQQKGIALMQEAIDKDPSNAAAYAGLSLVYARSAHSPFPLPNAMQLGQAAAQHAIALDSTLADAWAALGLVRMYLQWDWAGAESALKRAIDLSPSFGEIRWHYSYLLLLSDRTGEAIAEGQQAHDLDPFNLAIGSDLVIQYLLRGRREEAAKLARELLKVPGRRSEAHGRAWDALGLALTAQGNYAEAIQAADSGRKLNPGLTSNLVYSLVKAGRVDSARAVLFTYERTPLTAITAFNRAVMHGLVGDNDGFFRWIRYEPHHAWLPWIRVLPEFAPPSVQRDPRFALEMRRMNLPMPRR